MTTALVISGGGDKGAFGVGVVETLIQHGCQFDFIVGTSTGALIAPLLAIGDLNELVRLYTTVRKKDILRLNWWRPWYAWIHSLYHTKPLEKLIRRTMKGERFQRMQASRTPIYLCTVAAQDSEVWYWTQVESTHKQVRTWQSFDEFVRAVLASTNQPVIMPASIIDGKQCYDGGVREIAPISVTRELGADKIYAVVNSPRDSQQLSGPLMNIAEIGLWALDRMSAETLNNDIDINAGADMVVIRPDKPLPSSGLDFEPEVMRQMRALGQTAARTALDVGSGLFDLGKTELEC